MNRQAQNVVQSALLDCSLECVRHRGVQRGEEGDDALNDVQRHKRKHFGLLARQGQHPGRGPAQSPGLSLFHHSAGSQVTSRRI